MSHSEVGAIFNLKQVRADTRGCEGVVHFNNAGASLPPRCVTDTVVGYLRSEELRGSSELAAERHADLEGAHDSVARLIGGQASEIAFLDTSTRAWQSAVHAMPWKRGDAIVTTEAEYPSSVFTYLHLQEKFGVEVRYVPNDSYGQLDIKALRNAIDKRTRLIAATHIPTYSGLINPVAAVGVVAREARVPFLLDACQSVGQVRIDVEEIGCDLLAAGGRKFLRGPRGVAFLWVRSGLLKHLRPEGLDNFSANWTAKDRLEMRADARRFELYERSPALHLGLGAAAEYALRLGGRTIEERVVSLGAELRERLRQLPGVEVHDEGEYLGGIVTFTVRNHASENVVQALLGQRINVSLTPQKSAMRVFPGRGLSAVVRASVHYYNSTQELDVLVQALTEL